MTTVKQFQVTFDCAEPDRVARFWCGALGYVASPEDLQDEWSACSDPTGVGR